MTKVFIHPMDRETIWLKAANSRSQGGWGMAAGAFDESRS